MISACRQPAFGAVGMGGKKLHELSSRTMHYPNQCEAVHTVCVVLQHRLSSLSMYAGFAIGDQPEL